MASWKSLPLYILYRVLGWIAIASWSFSFYPQVILNYKRKSVTGLNFDFLVLNFTKHSCYLIYNAGMFFGPTIQRHYREKYGRDEMIPVAANDAAFSVHAVLLLTAVTLFQVLVYDRGKQRVSRICIAITFAVWMSAIVCLGIAWRNHYWLWLVSVFSMYYFNPSFRTAIKYIPQAFMNFRRKSTEGWSIGNILLDLLGAMTNYAQMTVQSIDQGSMVNFYGNIGKTLLSLEVVFFDLCFVIQHYVFYRPKNEGNLKIEEESGGRTSDLLVKTSELPSLSSVQIVRSE